MRSDDGSKALRNLTAHIDNLFEISADYVNTFDNPFTILWILSSVISSCYAYTWDIKMDWGLFDKNANENKFLREEIVYSSTVSLVVLNLSEASVTISFRL